jgi:hypothetical protein
MSSGDDNDGFKVRSYVLTGGRTRSGTDLPLETMVRVTTLGTSAAPRLALERKKIVSLAADPLSLAEISAHLSIPLGVARVLVGDMVEEGLLDSHKPAVEKGERPDVALLEKVLDGLQTL